MAYVELSQQTACSAPRLPGVVQDIHRPPLRERGEDLPLLLRYFLRRFSREMGREVQEAAPEALERLRGYPWPGNVRELQSVLKQALLRAHGPVLLPDFLPELRDEGRGMRDERLSLIHI